MSESLTKSNTVREPLIGLVSVFAEKNDKMIKRSNKRMYRATMLTFELWILMTLIVLTLSPKESFKRLVGAERQVSIMAIIVMFLANCSRLLPLMYHDRDAKQRASFWKNGYFIAAFSTQFIAMSAHLIMVLYPTPVVIDPFTGGRVHLVRWAEWAPLAFLLTFLAEEIDLPSPAQDRMSYIHAIAMLLSVTAGLLFPFCPNFWSWVLLLVFSSIMFFTLYYRIYQKCIKLATLEKGASTKSVDVYNRARLSLTSLQELAVVWTLLITLHFFAALAPHFVESDSVLNNLELSLITETFCEVISKYLHVIAIEGVYKTLFDERAINTRKLEQVRRMMSVLWEKSSDTIAISVEASVQGKRICLVSPTFFNLAYGKRVMEKKKYKDRALVIEMEEGTRDFVSEKSRARVFFVDISEPFVSASSDLPLSDNRYKHLRPAIQSIGELLCKARASKEADIVLIHDMVREFDPEVPSNTLVQCEAKVSKLADDTSILVVIRDISERIKRFEAEKTLAVEKKAISERLKRFEAEKRLAVEQKAREKDSQTNRFTRHEVKNGLLSAIGICETLVESLDPKKKINVVNSNTAIHQEDRLQPAISCVADLELTLQEVLDTVMSEAMARDVIHEVYEPRLEPVDVEAVLHGVGGVPSNNPRFPVVTIPDELPIFRMDPQLLRHIHRNALTNACKYGKQGGEVRTEVRYSAISRELQLSVFNSPGPHHDELLELGSEASSLVFLAGNRLHASFEDEGGVDSREVSHSSGDGAWIMQKCARTLGGCCSIQFDPGYTLFTMTCPVSVFADDPEASLSRRIPFQELPKSTWGIAIDDSKVQRKLLQRLFLLTGIQKDRQLILGASDDELLSFNDVIKRMIQDNPNDRFLIIADENLDVVQDLTHYKTISGSLSIEQLRRDLPEDDERRILTLVRSANDSGEDIALYSKRAHGFMPKAPIVKDRVIEAIIPLWMERFPSQDNTTHIPRVNSEICMSIEKDEIVTSSNDLLQLVDSIDNFLEFTDIQTSWNSVWDRLHILKGDLMTVPNSNSPRVAAVIEAIDNLRGPSIHSDFEQRWKLIRALIVSLA